MDGVLAFIAIAAILTVTPGATTALVMLGVQALLHSRRGEQPPEPREAGRGAFRDGLVTSLANPKLSVFFVALFPQFVPEGAPVLPYTLAMAATIVVLDFAWYLLLAAAVSRAQRALRGALSTWIERVSGTVLVGLGARLALSQR